MFGCAKRLNSMRQINVLMATWLIAGTSAMLAANAAAEMPNDLKYWQSAASPAQEAYIEEPLPPGFQVIVSPLQNAWLGSSRPWQGEGVGSRFGYGQVFRDCRF